MPKTQRSYTVAGDIRQAALQRQQASRIALKRQRAQQLRRPGNATEQAS